ncbi:MAG: DUF6783 domain-containing protein, partial [Blautia faecis]
APAKWGVQITGMIYQIRFRVSDITDGHRSQGLLF